MGKSTISMAIFNSYVKLPEGSLLEGTQQIPQNCGPRRLRSASTQPATDLAATAATATNEPRNLYTKRSLQ